MDINYKEKLRGKTISALVKYAHKHYQRGHFKTFNKEVEQSGLLEDAAKDWPRFMRMNRSELVRYIRERNPHTKEYKLAAKDERKKKRIKEAARKSAKKPDNRDGAEDNGD